MAKADIKASSKGISTSADRGSGSEPKWERSIRKRVSAERSLRTSPGARAMVSHSLDPSDKMGSSGEYYAGWIREMGDQKQRLFKGKTPGRELLQEQIRRGLPDPDPRCQDLPGPLERIIRAGLVYEPSHRPSLRAFLDD